MADPAATQWDEASREMRERALEAARRAHPDADAMLRAIAALPVAPSPLSREPATLLELPDGGAELRRGETSLKLTGAVVPTILAWHRHMAEHGRAWGETYLAGVAHGLANAQVEKLERLLADVRLRNAAVAARQLDAGRPPED